MGKRLAATAAAAVVAALAGRPAQAGGDLVVMLEGVVAQTPMVQDGAHLEDAQDVSDNNLFPLAWGGLASLSIPASEPVDFFVAVEGRRQHNAFGVLDQGRIELGLRQVIGFFPLQAFVEAGVGAEVQRFELSLVERQVRGGPGVSFGFGARLAAFQVLLRGTAAAIPGGFDLSSQVHEAQPRHWEAVYSPSNLSLVLGGGLAF